MLRLETVTPKLPSTIDAAALCKMADRGQITGKFADEYVDFVVGVLNAVARLATRKRFAAAS